MSGSSIKVSGNQPELIERNNTGSASPDQTETIGLNKCGVQNKFEKQHSLQDLLDKEAKETKIPAFQRGRSNSDGAALQLLDSSEAFPSLSNTVLEKLGLYGDATRSVALPHGVKPSFSFDLFREQLNEDSEVERLKDKLALLKPLCVDFETADLLSNLFAQVETLTKAASLVSIAAERYGAVQHEERLTESVQLMVTHVQTLKQQRDSAFRQLQYTKRVLQEPVVHAEANAANQNNPHIDQNVKLNRRISDLSFRASLGKTRSSRLDRYFDSSLGMELNKIKEMSLDEGFKDEPLTVSEKTTPEVSKEDLDADFEASCLAENVCAGQMPKDEHIVAELFSIIKLKCTIYIEGIRKKLLQVSKKWSETGYLHAFLNSCAVLCFSVSILTLASIFLEQECTKGPTYWLFPWLKKSK
ncbi:hypothetical protein HUJ04_010661 [Dendroctonus ponderosae]|nr:hypothetical protein HUJ04_010661 [Dendroctonus ponderosae]